MAGSPFSLVPFPLSATLFQQPAKAGSHRREEAPMLGGRPWNEWISQYGSSHQHPVNRFCHTVGIPLIVISLVAGVVSIGVPGLRWIAASLFVGGWVLQFVGHAVEG